LANDCVGTASETRGRHERRSRSANTMKRVLLIEDDLEQAEALKEALSETLHMTDGSVEVAVSGMEGIEKARQLRPDVVLCDIGLPDIQGDEVARRLRADPELKSIPLLALSAHALPEDREQSIRAGFDEHLTKPPSFEMLEKQIAEAAAKHKQ
jgi:CheY-like chemotaxis protein